MVKKAKNTYLGEWSRRPKYLFSNRGMVKKAKIQMYLFKGMVKRTKNTC
jgi:hypothetical protein